MKYISQTLKKFNLQCPGHIFSSTTDNTNTNFRVAEDLNIEHPIRCAAHLLDLTLKAVYKSDQLKSIFQKTKKLSLHFHSTGLALSTLKKLQQDTNVKPLKTITFSKTRWAGWIQLSQRLIELYPFITSYFIQYESDYEYQLERSDWKVLIEVCDMLKYVQELITVVESDSCTIDRIYPSVTGLIKKVILFRPTT